MQKTRCRQQQAYTLLEALLVLVVLVLMAIATLQYYHYQRWQRDFDRVQHSVQQILYAGNAFFYKQCQSWDLPIHIESISQHQLVDTGFLPNKALVTNPWGEPFTVEIDGRHRPVLLKVSARMDKLPGTKPSDQYYAQLLDATANKQTLTWTMTVTSEVNKANSNLWVLRHSLCNFKKQLGERAASSACLG